jgi:hypothetical protein
MRNPIEIRLEARSVFFNLRCDVICQGARSERRREHELIRARQRRPASEQRGSLATARSSGVLNTRLLNVTRQNTQEDATLLDLHNVGARVLYPT